MIGIEGLPALPGVYLVTHPSDGKRYTGSTSKSIRRRVFEHLRHLECNKHSNPHLQATFNRDGAGEFCVSVLRTMEGNTQREIREVEALFIEEYKSYDRRFGYNIERDTLQNAKEVSDETRERLRQTHLGRSPSEGVRLKLSMALKGRPKDPDHARRAADGRRKGAGWKKSPETIEKMRQVFTGKKQSAETVEKRVSKLRGKPRPEHVVEALVAASAREWVVISPNGTQLEVRNLSLFCRQNGLQASLMLKVACGERPHHRQWKCYRLVAGIIQEPQQSFGSPRWGVVEPNLTTHLIINLSEFCRQHGLSISCMKRVASKSQKAHKGWRCCRLSIGND